MVHSLTQSCILLFSLIVLERKDSAHAWTSTRRAVLRNRFERRASHDDFLLLFPSLKHRSYLRFPSSTSLRAYGDMMEGGGREERHRRRRASESEDRTMNRSGPLVATAAVSHHDYALFKVWNERFQAFVTSSQSIVNSSISLPSMTTVLAVSAKYRERFLSSLREGWYCFPLVLCLVPLITKAFFQIDATTPECWKMVQMDYIHHSKDAPLVLSFFLASNIFYFLAGIYLLIRYPPARIQTINSKSDQQVVTSSKHTDSDSSSTNPHISYSLVPTKRTGLGLWIVASGIISTIFHSFQALGDRLIAEGLCFVDHGVACSSILYFWRTCGRPRDAKVWALGIGGILALCLPLKPGYAFLHSFWHFLSAAAALLWTKQVNRYSNK